MRIKLMTFRYSGTLGGFDYAALVDFALDEEESAFREHLDAMHEVPLVSCVITTQDAVVPQAALWAAFRFVCGE